MEVRLAKMPDGNLDAAQLFWDETKGEVRSNKSRSMAAWVFVLGVLKGRRQTLDLVLVPENLHIPLFFYFSFCHHLYGHHACHLLHPYYRDPQKVGSG